MEAVRLCSARSESLRRTFLDRVSKSGGLHSKSFPALAGPARRKRKALFV
jgi:hypothetical protein